MSQPAIVTDQSAQQPVPTNIIQVSPQDTWRISEKALVGAILGIPDRGRQTFAEAVDATGIQYSDFLSRELGGIWFVMDRLYQAGQDIDISTIWAEVQKSDKAKGYITFDTLAYLANQKSGGHRTHAENIVDASVSASIKAALTDLSPLVNNPAIKASEKLRRVHKVVTDLSMRTEHATKSQTTNILDGLNSYLQAYDTAEQTGDIDLAIPTGFPQLDVKLDGWKNRTLNIIAGPPGSGKTVFLMTSALHAVMAGKRVLMVQLELPEDQSFRRILSAFAGIDSSRLKHHKLAGWETSRLPKALEKLAEFDKEKRFTLLTMNQPTLDDIKIKLDTLMLNGYDIIFFDYAGGAKIARDAGVKDDLEHHRNIYNAIDEWKKKYNVPIVAGAQYSFPQPQKHPGTYTMDMIYSSSFVKHNADTIMFLHPDKAPDDAPTQKTVSFVVVKARDGEKDYGSNLVVKAQAEMNMFRFVPSSSAFGNPPPLWDIHAQQQPADLGDL